MTTTSARLDIPRSAWVRSRVFIKRENRDTISDRSADLAEYLVKYTGYVSYSDLLATTKRHGLFMPTRYTKEFYGQKMRRVLSRSPQFAYARKRSIIGDWLLVFVLRYVSCVTVFLEKRDAYATPSQAAIRPESPC